MARVVMDTGPLVAYFYPRDAYHDWAVAQFLTFDLPLFTCEPVIAETCFLLGRNRLSPTHVVEAVERGVVLVDFRLADKAAPLREAIERYANVPMSLADACLVRMAEKTGLPICTLDSDFMIYRTRRGRALNLISPPDRSRALHEP